MLPSSQSIIRVPHLLYSTNWENIFSFILSKVSIFLRQLLILYCMVSYYVKSSNAVKANLKMAAPTFVNVPWQREDLKSSYPPCSTNRFKFSQETFFKAFLEHWSLRKPSGTLRHVFFKLQPRSSHVWYLCKDYLCFTFPYPFKTFLTYCCLLYHFNLHLISMMMWGWYVVCLFFDHWWR